MRDPGALLDLYRILDPAGEPELIHREAPEGATILDLGCGTGRITHALIRLGHSVTAVDFDERMLGEIRGAETVLSRIEDLDLGRTFGAVLLMSTLINRPDQSGRLALLASCRRHVAPNGVVLIERYDPEIGMDPRPTERRFAGITIRVSNVRRDGPFIHQSVEARFIREMWAEASATTLVRLYRAIWELWIYRDACFRAAWEAPGYTGPLIDVLTQAWEGATSADDIARRLAAKQDRAAIVVNLALLQERGDVARAGDTVTLTDQGRATRDAIESRTNAAYFERWPVGVRLRALEQDFDVLMRALE